MISRFIVFLFSLFLLTSCSSLSPDYNGNIIPNNDISKKNIKASEANIESNTLNIALVVPLGKEKEHIGNSLVKAAQLAVSDANNPHVNLTLINSELIDTSPEILLSKLKNNKVQIVIGPLYGPETTKISSLVKDKNITILSLSNDSTLKSDSLLIMGISPDCQTRIITNYAIGKGITHFHLLLPNNKYGQLIDSSVENIVVDKNNITHSINWYNPDNTEQVIDQLLVSIDNKEDQAILMPQGGENLSLLNTALSKHKLNNVTILGLQSWDHPNILEKKSLNNAVFLRKNISAEQFYDNFSRTFNLAGSNIDFITYNSIMMAINMNRDQLPMDKNTILENNKIYGKYSNVIFDQQGQSLYKLEITKIEKNELKIIETNP